MFDTLERSLNLASRIENERFSGTGNESLLELPSPNWEAVDVVVDAAVSEYSAPWSLRLLLGWRILLWTYFPTQKEALWTDLLLLWRFLLETCIRKKNGLFRPKECEATNKTSEGPLSRQRVNKSNVLVAVIDKSLIVETVGTSRGKGMWLVYLPRWRVISRARVLAVRLSRELLIDKRWWHTSRGPQRNTDT